MSAGPGRLASNLGRVISPNDFAQALKPIWTKWRGPLPRKIGLAISGGVDSMALASLCLRMAPQGSPFELMAFIVDHKLRPESSNEALSVKKSLETLGLSAEILTIGSNTIRLDRHLENNARIARYAALRHACDRHSIRALMVAHHADDQAATVLQRLLQKYYGRGIAGIDNLVNIPEHLSMQPDFSRGTSRMLAPRYAPSQTSHMFIEEEPIKLLRPLLGYRKADLDATCIEANVPWVEDATNADVALTSRNTIRFLHEKDLLPRALQQARLCELGDSVRKRKDAHIAMATSILDASLLKVDLPAGRVFCTIPRSSNLEMKELSCAELILGELLRQLLELACAGPIINAQTTDMAACRLLTDEQTESRVEVAGMMIEQARVADGTLQLVIKRANPSRVFASATKIEVNGMANSQEDGICWTRWYLWDARYWISLGHHSSIPDFPRNTVVRFRRPTDGHGRGLAEPARDLDLKRVLRAHRITPDSSFSMPVIATGPEDRIVAAPSFDFHLDEWSRYSPGAAEQNNFKYFYRIKHRSLPDEYTLPVEDEGNVL